MRPNTNITVTWTEHTTYERTFTLAELGTRTGQPVPDEPSALREWMRTNAHFHEVLDDEGVGENVRSTEYLEEVITDITIREGNQ